MLKACLTAFGLGVCVSAGAQVTDERMNRETTMEREYDPSVRDAGKVNRLPEVKEPEVLKRSIDYSPFTAPAEPEKEFTVLPAGRVMTDVPHNRRRGYFHLGGGMFANIDGDLGYHILESDKDKLYLFATHRSTNGDVTFADEDNRKVRAKLNDNLIQADYSRLFSSPATRLNMGVSWGYTGFNYYGTPFLYSASSVWEEAALDTETNQANQTFAVHAGVDGEHQEKCVYLLDASFRHFNQKYGRATTWDGIRENQFTLRFDLAPRFGVDRRQRAGLAGKVDGFAYQYPSPVNDSTGYRSHAEATFSPYYRVEGETWHLRLGANVMLVGGDSLVVSASPNVSAEVKVFNRTVFYAEAQGELRANDAYGLSRQNRYMDHALAVRPSRTWLDATVGIRSGIAAGLRIDLFGGYRITKDDFFFIPNSYFGESSEIDFASYSTVLQTDAARLHAGAALAYSYRDRVEFSLRGVYNQWDMKYDGRDITHISIDRMEMKPYGRPEVELNA
ncbi:MAG: TonB-dependent receptor, partial [Tannerella sp.]|nr:TonB-dependent receptor [Tannerella sp.]